MKCVCCGHLMKKKKVNYNYTESGLKNVILKELVIWDCANCGDESIEIPNIEDLHNLIARKIALQKNKLLPEEIRFLRSHLGFSSKDFSVKILRVKPETLSRWENGKSLIGDTPEKLLRVLILAQHGPFRNYQDLEETGKIKRKTPVKRQFISKKNDWEEAA